MTDQPYEADADADDVEGHGRFGQFVDADATIDDPYSASPPGSPQR